MKRLTVLTFIVMLSLFLAGCEGGTGDLFAGLGDVGGDDIIIVPPDDDGGDPGGGGDDPVGGGGDPAAGGHAPEPSSMALLGLGALGVLFGFKRRKS